MRQSNYLFVQCSTMLTQLRVVQCRLGNYVIYSTRSVTHTRRQLENHQQFSGTEHTGSTKAFGNPLIVTHASRDQLLARTVMEEEVWLLTFTFLQTAPTPSGVSLKVTIARSGPDSPSGSLVSAARFCQSEGSR